MNWSSGSFKRLLRTVVSRRSWRLRRRNIRAEMIIVSTMTPSRRYRTARRRRQVRKLSRKAVCHRPLKRWIAQSLGQLMLFKILKKSPKKTISVLFRAKKN